MHSKHPRKPPAASYTTPQKPPKCPPHPPESAYVSRKVDECKPLNDGSFCREVFGHVVYHIVKAPDGAGDTEFAHLVGRCRLTL